MEPVRLVDPNGMFGKSANFLCPYLNGFLLFVHKQGGEEYLAECDHSLRQSVVAFVVAHGNAKIIHGYAEQCDDNAGNQILGRFQRWQQHENHAKHNENDGNAGIYANGSW